MFNLKTKKILISQDVTFVELEFPFENIILASPTQPVIPQPLLEVIVDPI